MLNDTEKYHRIKSYLENNQAKFSKEFYRDFYEILQNCETLQKEKRFLHVKLQTTQSELLQKQELLKNVENSMDSAVFYKDLQHRYIGCNQVFEYYMGYEEKEILGKTDFDFFPEEDAKKFYEINEKVIQTQSKLHYKEWVKLNGKEIYIFLSKTPLFDKQKKLIGIVTIARDITHEYEMQRDIERKNIMLIQQNKLVSMGEMIANIAHQWRQPLNTLGLLIQKMGLLYKMKKLNEKEIDQEINSAMSLMQKMSETIDDFRFFFSNEKVLEPFLLEEIFEKVYSIVYPNLNEYKIEYSFQSRGLHYVFGQKNEFFHVIVNLISNAIDALKESTKNKKIIEVSFTDDSDDIIIKIYDNGPGIPKEKMEKIFEPYFTMKQEGTGLGLYISKIIIQEHMHGKLTVSCESCGTSFYIRLKRLS